MLSNKIFVMYTEKPDYANAGVNSHKVVKQARANEFILSRCNNERCLGKKENEISFVWNRVH